MLAAGAVGVWLTAREAERRGFKKEDIYDAALWIILGGAITAAIVSWRCGWKFGRFADAAAPGLVLAPAIISASSHCYGGVCGSDACLKWAILLML